MWYEFRQNNSGGDFVEDAEKGLGFEVWIEADSMDEANRRAEDIGIYFDGVSTGEDCDCCGDRWSRAYGDGQEKPILWTEAYLHPKAGGFIRKERETSVC